MEELSFRLAEAKDSNALFTIRQRAILGIAASMMDSEDARCWAMRLERHGMAERMARMEIWVAEARGAIVGWVGIEQGWLENLYRDPDPAWRGVGSALLAHAERLMRGRGYRVVGLKSAASAVCFYQRHGYEPSAPPEPDGSWRHQKILLAPILS